MHERNVTSYTVNKRLAKSEHKIENLGRNKWFVHTEDVRRFKKKKSFSSQSHRSHPF